MPARSITAAMGQLRRLCRVETEQVAERYEIVGKHPAYCRIKIAAFIASAARTDPHASKALPGSGRVMIDQPTGYRCLHTEEAFCG
jgi:hypothetical protein